MTMAMTDFAPFGDPPYYAVIFSSQNREDLTGYTDMAARLEELAKEQPGYIGIESLRDANGFGITISYWTDEDAVRNWKAVAEHKGAQRLGKSRWYAHYRLRVARIERQYEGPEGRS